MFQKSASVESRLSALKHILKELSMIAILCTDGQMHLNEIRKECQTEKWVPLFSYTENDDPTPIIPIFSNQNILKSFIKRNLPKEWLRGGVDLCDEDLEKMKARGWRLREMTFPNKLKGLKNIKFGLEILELDEKPDLHVSAL